MKSQKKKVNLLFKEATMLIIYTDGCCLNNQSKENRGGWAYIAIFEDGRIIKSNGYVSNTTNQKMELIACIEAMQFALALGEQKIEIFTDSAYVYNCVKQSWYLRWLNNGWKNSKGELVKNRDLWETFLKLLEMAYFKFTSVKAHTGDKYNEEADTLARHAATMNKRTVEKEETKWKE
jgi:ribonuclease HI